MDMKLFGKVLSIATAGAVAVIVVPSAATAARGTRAGAQYTPAASQKIVTLFANKTTYKSAGGAREGSVSKNRPITGEATNLPLLGTSKKGSTTWYHVRLPGRPNSHTGWITSTHTNVWVDHWHIVVHVGPDTSGYSNQRRMMAYDNGKLVRNWLAVTGAPGRVTPMGQFFVEENINEGYNFPGGPFALATSARSTTYSSFDGGPGQVAIHGMSGGLNATPGTAVSHGCVRLLNNEITWLSNRILPGTPVTIVR
jgi:hypothetical protein